MANNFEPRRADVDEVELVGGFEKRHLELVGYDESWPDIFLDHQGRLRKALGTAEVEVEHIGSTSVPGLAANPIVDIVVTVDDITAEEDCLAPLLAAGYKLRTREPGHRLVCTPARDVHIQILQRGDEAVDNYRLFRNRLRADTDDRALYEDTKRALLNQGFDDMNAYADAKTEVIAAIMKRALSAGA
ncbi:MAG: GrpB family protein [Kineosporiaceae bacterium]|nr:GrpB family protein [Aeromicrobium sp.]